VNDPDAPTLLTYAPTSWLDRVDMYGDRHDDDSGSDDIRYDFPNDPDDDGRWCRPEPLDCGDGLPDDSDNPAVHDPDWLPF